jgi:hypothetical protein
VNCRERDVKGRVKECVPYHLRSHVTDTDSAPASITSGLSFSDLGTHLLQYALG